jgi:hypothetical protein
VEYREEKWAIPAISPQFHYKINECPLPSHGKLTTTSEV